jgi:hypothetical protein
VKGQALAPSALYSRLADLWERLRRHGEPTVFAILTFAHLIPVWAFAYLPTQDGPAHLNNAQIIKDYANPTAGYSDIFELRMTPLPNLTSHLLLAALLFAAPPLIAEKVLVSLYVVGFAYSFRYYLGAFGPRCVPLSWVGLLLVYQRCFWMGFYNYCLGMVLLWVVVGYCLRWRGVVGPRQVLTLLLLFTAAYFTHLAAFLIALVAALGAVILAPPRRLLAGAGVVIAAAPGACLTVYYLESTGFFRAYPPSAHFGLASLGRDLAAFDEELFAHHVGSVVAGTLVLVFLLVLLAVFTIAERRHDGDADGAGPLFPIVLGLFLLAAYFLVPGDLAEHGGFLKTRLAPVVFLTCIACFRESAHFEVRLFFRALTIVLVGLNLTLVTLTVAAGNQELQQFNVGIQSVGTGQRLFVLQTDPRPTPLVNPLLHAADYYCLGTRNVNLDNYQAEMLHFPVNYRAGIRRGRNHWNSYPDQDLVDVILCWHPIGTSGRRPPPGWEEKFHDGSLRIWRRAAGP